MRHSSESMKNLLFNINASLGFFSFLFKPNNIHIKRKNILAVSILSPHQNFLNCAATELRTYYKLYSKYEPLRYTYQ